MSRSDAQASSFASDVLKIVIGTTLAQIIVLLSSPILTRLYGPDAFGLLGIFTAITSIIGIIACLSLNYAILLPKADEEAANLLGMSLIMVLLITFITVPIIFFAGDLIAGLLGAPELRASLILIPPFVFVSGTFLALNSWNSRTKHFGRLSVATVTQSVAATGTRLGAGFTGYTTGASLICASVIGTILSTVILGAQIWRDDYVFFRKSISWKGMLDGLIRYKKFPLIESGSRLLNAVSWQLPVFFLAAFFSPVVAGFYVLGFMVFQMPMNLIGISIAKVFIQRASLARYEDTLPLLVENVFRVLVVFGIFPILTMTLIGSDFFTVIFGGVWSEAGFYAQLLSIWAFVWFLASPISSLWTVLEKQEFGLRITSLNFITRFISLGIGALVGSPVVALLLFAVSGVFVYGYLNVKMLVYSGVELNKAKSHLFSSLKLFCPFGVILIGLIMADVDSFFIVVVSILLGVVYYTYIGLTDPQVKSLISFNSPKN